MTAHPPIKGAYTELFAGLSQSITEKNNGGYGEHVLPLIFSEFVKWPQQLTQPCFSRTLGKN